MNKKPRNSIREGVINKTVLEMSIFNITVFISSFLLAFFLMLREVNKVDITVSNTVIVPIGGPSFILLVLLVLTRFIKRKYGFNSSLIEVICASIIVAKILLLLLKDIVFGLQPVISMAKAPAVLMVLLLVTFAFGSMSLLLKPADHFSKKFNGSEGLKADVEHVSEANKLMGEAHDAIISYLKKKLRKDTVSKNKQLH